MPEYCLTCGGELPGASRETPFCPHCGAPQLKLAAELRQPEPEETAGTATTGMLPPPRPHAVDWRMAICCAGAVAVVGGLLAVIALRVPLLTPATVLWVVSGSLITLGLYQNRRPAARMDAGIGARIGAMVGVCLGVGLATAVAVAGVVARFGMHAMASFDGQMAMLQGMVQQAMQQSAQRSGTALPPEVLRFVQSQEYRAASVLTYCGFAAVGLLVISALGGAFGGLLRTRHRAAV
jgi:hypothetical protein